MREFARCAAVAILLAATASSQAGAVTPSSIPVHGLTLDGMTIGVLTELAEKYHVVIGIYGTFIGTDSLWLHLSFADGTLGEVLDAIVKADPRFEWKQADDGAVHFVSRDAPLSLLDTTVHSFDVKSPGRHSIWDDMRRVPEVARWLQGHGCVMGEIIIIVGRPPKRWGRFAVHAGDVPLSAVFDEIALKSGTYRWAAIQDTANPCRINTWF